MLYSLTINAIPCLCTFHYYNALSAGITPSTITPKINAANNIITIAILSPFQYMSRVKFGGAENTTLGLLSAPRGNGLYLKGGVYKIPVSLTGRRRFRSGYLITHSPDSYRTPRVST